MKQYIAKLTGLFIVLLMFLFISTAKVQAAGEGQVTIGKINYDNLSMEVKSNGNSMIYYSMDKKIWSEIEGEYNPVTGNYLMDISWISPSVDKDLYFKGDVVKAIQTVTLPAQESSLKITFNKVDGDFTFVNMEEARYFQWRKSADYHWTEVSMNESDQSFQEFLKAVDTFRVKGTKIVFRIPQVIGLNDEKVGSRPSKEITVTIAARSAAPKVKVNFSKLTLNTTLAMEYYDSVKKRWVECEKTMSLSDITPTALFKNGGKDVMLQIRTAETERSPYSKTAYLLIPGQSGPLTIGDNTSDSTFYYMNNRLNFYFSKASTSNKYQYAISKNGVSGDPTLLSWKSVTSSKVIKLTKTSAPEGAFIYIRKQGVDYNATKGIEMSLPSEVTSYIVKYE